MATLGAGLTKTILSHAAIGQDAPELPNILWLTCEDMGPNLGCYGDACASTPNIDALAARGVRYLNCWSNAPVCAPARTTIITGMYPPAVGAEHMRSSVPLPDRFRLYPHYLREAGYYCTNNVKEDFNVIQTGPLWDEVSNAAHWRNRPAAQPFFAIFNQTVTHESQIRSRPHTLVTDPDRVSVPPYHPDTPEVRQDWAQYYDNIMSLDAWVGERLRELEEAGLADNTIVLFYSDHGSGMPRHKRWLYQAGLHVPLIVRIPPKYRHLAPPDYQEGGTSSRLVGFVDLAPTVLSLAGIAPPAHFQGRAFLGSHVAPEPRYLYGFRARMDERIDLTRAVRDTRYLYIRNYMPHKPQGQYLEYMFETPTTRVWKDLYDQGSLNDVQRRFWEPKPPEELYDIQDDPHQIHNLVGSPEHQAILEDLRKAHRDWERSVRDLSLLPESEMLARAAGTTPYEMGQDRKRYDLDRVFAAADRASLLRDEDIPMLADALNQGDSAVRYWGAMGLLMRGEKGVAANREALRKAATDDPAQHVRVAAAEALGLFGNDADVSLALDVLLEAADAKKHGYLAVLPALNALDLMDRRARSAAEAIAAFVEDESLSPPRSSTYIKRIVAKTLADIKGDGK